MTSDVMVLLNCIVWNNNGPEISGNADVIARYCDIQDGYTGLGNIDVDPEFIGAEWGDYRLHWGSPCIDAGHPDPLYNDPDGTRADMGGCCFDQSLPLRIALTEHDSLIVMGEDGGSFVYDAHVTNSTTAALDVQIWLDVTLPDGTVYGPLVGPITTNVPGATTLSRERTQTVPAAGPPGWYYYNAYAVAGADTSTDSFFFRKMEGDSTGCLAGWFNTGEPFDVPAESASQQAAAPPRLALTCQPNPFNAVTTIHFDLPVASRVKLDVFDVNSRSVGVGLAPTRRYNPGSHTLTFDASHLPSGVYVYRITAEGIESEGRFTESGKMVLLK